MAKQTIDVLECNSGTSKKGNAYNIALIRCPSGDGRVGKVFSDVKLPIDADVEVDLVLEPNQEMFLSPTIKQIYN